MMNFMNFMAKSTDNTEYIFEYLDMVSISIKFGKL